MTKPSLRAVVPWVVALLAGAAAVTFFLLWRGLEAEAASRDEVTAVARDFVTTLTNFSHETIESDVEEIRSFAVGEFAEEADTFFGADGVAAIREAQATSEGRIESLFVQALDSDEASVFAVVTETIANALTDEPQTDVLRLEVGMIETDDGWKVNRVEVFQAPGGGILTDQPAA
jgi:hypothetical protein